jgi:hypothetical protein
MLLLSNPFQVAGKPLPAAKAVHPFFVSVTEVTQNKAEGTLEISCKFLRRF